jgi:hypothetical protein
LEQEPVAALPQSAAATDHVLYFAAGHIWAGGLQDRYAGAGTKQANQCQQTLTHRSIGTPGRSATPDGA